MKVKELIAQLQKLHPEEEIFCGNEGEQLTFEEIYWAKTSDMNIPIICHSRPKDFDEIKEKLW